MSKLADYGVVVMIELAKDNAKRWCTAKELAQRTGLPAPTVSKVLKSLENGGVVESRRGNRGGYLLARLPCEIAVLDIVRAIDGEPSLTRCQSPAAAHCVREPICPARPSWEVIGQVLREQLGSLTLSDMLSPLSCEILQRRMTYGANQRLAA